MLTKRQLEDAINCWFGNCEECSCNGLQKEHGAFDCMVQIIETALAYRAMLERLLVKAESMYSYVDDNEAGYDPGTYDADELGEIEELLEEIEALLKESEGEKK